MGAVPKIWHCILPLRAACSHSTGADLHIAIITIMNSVLITIINTMRVMHRNIPTTVIATTTTTTTTTVICRA